MQLSICIPTFNRSKYLYNCINSIQIASKLISNFDFEVCVSDNGSESSHDKIINNIIYRYKDLKINYFKFSKNQGFALNALKVVSMAKGKYVWLIGDDDLLTPTSLVKLSALIKENINIDFFFINSFNLDQSFLDKFEYPFNTFDLPKKMSSICKLNKDKIVNFWKLIDPEVSWEFLISIYLGVFNRKKWEDNKNVLNFDNLQDLNVWSNIDNTLLYPMIICSAFKNSKCYIFTDAIHVNLSGIREWSEIYKFIEIVRIPELLNFYRSQGLPLLRYLICKNFALRNFFNYFISIYLKGDKSGKNYINFYKHIMLNLYYPNVYLSPIRYLFRKLKQLVKI